MVTVPSTFYPGVCVFWGTPGGYVFGGFLLRNFSFFPQRPRCSGQVAAPSTPASARQAASIPVVGSGQETLGLEKNLRG